MQEKLKAKLSTWFMLVILLIQALTPAVGVWAEESTTPKEDILSWQTKSKLEIKKTTLGKN